MLAEKIEAGRANAAAALRELKQVYFDEFVEAEAEAQSLRRTLRLFNTESGPLDEIWQAAFARNWPVLKTDLVHCLEREETGYNIVQWNNLKRFLKMYKLYENEKIKALFPVEEEGPKEACVAYKTFVNQMHLDCENLMRGKPLGDLPAKPAPAPRLVPVPAPE